MRHSRLVVVAWHSIQRWEVPPSILVHICFGVLWHECKSNDIWYLLRKMIGPISKMWLTSFPTVRTHRMREVSLVQFNSIHFVFIGAVCMLFQGDALTKVGIVKLAVLCVCVCCLGTICHWHWAQDAQVASKEKSIHLDRHSCMVARSQ